MSVDSTSVPSGAARTFGPLPPGAVHGLVHGLVFIAVVAVLKHIDIAGEHFDRKGIVTVLYTGGRAILSMYLLAASTVLGALILRLWRHRSTVWGEASVSHLVASFFLGGSLFGLVGTIVGIVGWLSLPFALAITLPLVILSPQCLRTRTWQLLKSDYWPAPAARSAGVMACRILTCLLLVSAAAGLVWKGLYLASAEADVWELYVQYFREVIKTGSVGPGDAWAHYFASKDAGFIHIASLLSDEFAAPLVSWCYCVGATVLLLDLLRSVSRDPAWALLGGVLFLSAVIADPTVGAFFRSHAITAALIAFLIWAAVQILLRKPETNGAIRFSAITAAFYFGLYLSPVAPLVVAFYGSLFALAMVLRRFRHAALTFAALVFATGAGILSELLVCYLATGLASLVSVKLFWPIADQVKFADRIGDSGLLYFIFYNNGNASVSNLSLWLARVLRLHQFAPMWWGAAAVLVGCVVRLGCLIRTGKLSANEDLMASRRMVLAIVILFSLVAMIPLLTIENESIMRLYFFLDLLTPILIVLVLINIIERWRPALFGVQILRPSLALWAAVVLWLSLSSQGDGILASLSFASGRLTTFNAMKSTANVFAESDRLDFMREVRREIGPNAKVFALNYAPGPAYAFPRPGLMSEPAFTLGPRYLDIIFGNPEQAVQALRERKINYFHVSVATALFSGVAFSRLFRADTIGSYLKVVLRHGNQMLLTWSQPGTPPSLPLDFLAILELKQKATMQFAFTPAFDRMIEALVRRAAAEASRCGGAPCGAIPSLITSTEGAVRRGLAMDRLLPENRVSAENILNEIKTELNRKIFNDKQALDLQSDDGRARLVLTVSETVQIAFMNACIVRFGRPFCEPLTHRDERIPYGVIYQSRSNVENMLRSGPGRAQFR